tara:strand:+ start:806 stop:1738 length:933 start_codon:yes stop_codon:yes gene_type:complete
MHRYFLVPVSIFFLFIILLVLYFQYIEDEWKYFYKAEEKVIPKYCDDNNLDYKKTIIKLNQDIILNRSFSDKKDKQNNLIHLVYFVPCDVKSRDFDVNGKILNITININSWFYKNSNKQKIRFDHISNIPEITFIRVNKTISWFNQYTSDQNKKEDTASRVEKIVLSNKNIFHNFDSKKFIIFFEGWEKRKNLFTTTCGRARFKGKVSIFYTNNKYLKTGTCVEIKDKVEDDLGSEEQTILHELIHLLGFPNDCSLNKEHKNSFHVNDSEKDIMNKFSGGKYLDYNNDDYYNHGNSKCADLMNSNYLFSS